MLCYELVVGHNGQPPGKLYSKSVRDGLEALIID